MIPLTQTVWPQVDDKVVSGFRVSLYRGILINDLKAEVRVVRVKVNANRVVLSSLSETEALRVVHTYKLV